MTADDNRLVPAGSASPGDAAAVRYLNESLASGKNWYRALLGAVGLWSSASEEYSDRSYVYLIDGEAFDWLLLAERLCGAVADLLPEKERDDLLFHGVPPLELDASEVKELIGEKKYTQYLNYFYGVTVEEALLLAVQEAVDKEMWVRGYRRDYSSDEAYRRIYGVERDELLKRFRKEKKHPHRLSTTIDEMKQFTYWLFKFRLKSCEKARIASDTKKALEYLKKQWRQKGVSQVLAADLDVFLPG